jgi:phosphoribosylamine---glycine ligase
VVGKKIKGLPDAQEVPRAVVFHAGTRREDDGYYTHGGRILGVSGTGKSLDEARMAAYRAVDKIEIDGAFYRKDIGEAGANTEEAAGAKAALGVRNG